MERIGTLASLHRYPFKSMAGEPLQEAFVSYSGMLGDRVYAFVANPKRIWFPWMTAREGHEMLLFTPRFEQPPDPADAHPGPARYRIEVTTPEGKVFAADSAELRQHLEQRFGRRLTLRFSERGMHDSRPISMFGLATLQALSRECGTELDRRRFRANFYAEWDDPQPFYEDSLVGKRLQVGDKLSLMVVKKDARCIIITLDPDTAQGAPVVLEKVAREHKGCAGVYATVVHDGQVKPGDPIFVL